jgi:putative flippase GtrA
VLWGVVVGAVNIGSLWLFHYKFGINEIISNLMAWILYNFVSFVTNRKSVFHTQTENARQYLMQLIQFYLSRVLTLLVEEGIIFLLVTLLGWWAMGVKIFTSILVIFLNYFISKKYIF